MILPEVGDNMLLNSEFPLKQSADSDSAEGTKNSSEKRMHERLLPKSSGELQIELLIEGRTYICQLVDYSPFGLGATVETTHGLEGALRVGEIYGMTCVFGQSRFPNKGRLANVRTTQENGVEKLRLGFALVSDATPVRDKLEQRRAEMRLELDQHLSPLCYCEDELLFEDRVFMRVQDISASGLGLELPAQRVPLVPKQRHWFTILIPFFGELKCYVRVAYVRPFHPEEVAKGKKGFLVGVQFLKSIVDISPALCEYLFHTHPELDHKDFLAAGFSKETFFPWEFQIRPRLLLSEENNTQSQEHMDIVFEGQQGSEVAKMKLSLNHAEEKLVVEEFRVLEKSSEQMWPKMRLAAAVARFLLVAAKTHLMESLNFSDTARSQLNSFLNLKHSTYSMPTQFVTSLPPPLWVDLANHVGPSTASHQNTRALFLRVFSEVSKMAKRAAS
jgi:hypothetical protein